MHGTWEFLPFLDVYMTEKGGCLRRLELGGSSEPGASPRIVQSGEDHSELAWNMAGWWRMGPRAGLGRNQVTSLVGRLEVSARHLSSVLWVTWGCLSVSKSRLESLDGLPEQSLSTFLWVCKGLRISFFEGFWQSWMRIYYLFL